LCAAKRPPPHVPAARRPVVVSPPPSVRRADGSRSQGGCDARYTRPVAPIGPTAFPSAAAAAAARPYLSRPAVRRRQ